MLTLTVKVGALPEGINSRCWVFGVAPNAPKADEVPRGDAGGGR